ncbi:DUF302 domain-containing protein [Neptuniibacter sp. 1_MG-2023]|uniref:DUF302 domain-containing protein n=1 Tax=Neptuniibacter sp. 1_MG-2023 TaxID=3062662 RepID=UPI0026E39E27|nr:DUF302 domain-containing protein [Neptuniibacter sp. 1_MG-2023]MDO6594872.1 DUF302 domain-containing protein [Neptuniibacter sp. 1_MG-2023]
MKKALIWAALTLGISNFSFAADGSSAENGLVSVPSTHGVKETADKLESVLTSKGMTVFTRINHTEGAKKAGKELRETEVVLFGNPKVGTPLMQCSQTMAIDLPQKALVWQDANGAVWLSYNDPHYLASRHNIKDCDAAVAKVSGALAKFAKAATE